jgi:hypothetical protein
VRVGIATLGGPVLALGAGAAHPRINTCLAHRNRDLAHFGGAPPPVISPAEIKSQLVRWTFDLGRPGEHIEQRATGQVKNLAMDGRSTVQEHVHIASRIPGHEGYLMFLVDRHDTQLSEVFVVDAQQLDRGPLAHIQVPFRLRCGVHGNLRAGRGTATAVTAAGSC